MRNARTLPEATEYPPQPDPTADAIQALAAQFEAAFQAQLPFFYGSGTDEESGAMIAEETPRVADADEKVEAAKDRLARLARGESVTGESLLEPTRVHQRIDVADKAFEREARRIIRARP
jgi:hypothetical protein